MSIHRPKRANTRKPDQAGSGKGAANASSAQKVPKWKEAVGAQPDEAFTAYDSTATFEKDALVLHSKFGKGLVLEVDGNKVHILFEEGVRRLLHGTPAA